jgi:hypothetical protein
MLKSRMMSRACRKHGEKRNACRVFGGEARRRETARRSKISWENNVTMDPRELEWSSMDWTYMAQDMIQWYAYFTLFLYKICSFIKYYSSNMW